MLRGSGCRGLSLRVGLRTVVRSCDPRSTVVVSWPGVEVGRLPTFSPSPCLPSLAAAATLPLPSRTRTVALLPSSRSRATLECLSSSRRATTRVLSREGGCPLDPDKEEEEGEDTRTRSREEEDHRRAGQCCLTRNGLVVGRGGRPEGRAMMMSSHLVPPPPSSLPPYRFSLPISQVHPPEGYRVLSPDQLHHCQ